MYQNVRCSPDSDLHFRKRHWEHSQHALPFDPPLHPNHIHPLPRFRDGKRPDDKKNGHTISTGHHPPWQFLSIFEKYTALTKSVSKNTTTQQTYTKQTPYVSIQLSSNRYTFQKQTKITMVDRILLTCCAHFSYRLAFFRHEKAERGESSSR